MGTWTWQQPSQGWAQLGTDSVRAASGTPADHHNLGHPNLAVSLWDTAHPHAPLGCSDGVGWLEAGPPSVCPAQCP